MRFHLTRCLTHSTFVASEVAVILGVLDILSRWEELAQSQATNSVQTLVYMRLIATPLALVLVHHFTLLFQSHITNRLRRFQFSKQVLSYICLCMTTDSENKMNAWSRSTFSFDSACNVNVSDIRGGQL